MPNYPAKSPESIEWLELDNGYMTSILTYLDTLTRHGRVFGSGNESIGAVVKVSLFSMLFSPFFFILITSSYLFFQDCFVLGFL